MREKLMASIRQHVASEYPKEACGLIIQSGNTQKYICCRNIADNPTETFTMSPEDKKATEALGEIIMIIHSHPDVVQLIPSEIMLRSAG